MLENFHDNDWKQKTKNQRCNRIRGAFRTGSLFPSLPHSNQTPPHAQAITSHHCHLLWLKVPFGPNPSSGSAHTPPSSRPLCMLLSPLSPWPWDPARGWGGRGNSDDSRTLDNWPLCACQMYFRLFFALLWIILGKGVCARGIAWDGMPSDVRPYPSWLPGDSPMATLNISSTMKSWSWAGESCIHPSHTFEFRIVVCVSAEPIAKDQRPQKAAVGVSTGVSQFVWNNF